MGYKKPTEVSRVYLENAALPNHAESYTVISHKFVIDNTIKLLTDSGFRITQQIYRANQSANVAQGIYHIIPTTQDNEILNEKDLGMIFAWTNSYDKSIRFQCSIGANVFVCNNGMVCGEMNYARRHSGSADYDILAQISSQIKNAEKIFKTILRDKNALQKIDLSKRAQAELLGRLYFEKELLEATQMTVVKEEMEKPSFDYQFDQENAWVFYNHVTHAFKKTHPRSWLSNTKQFHDFITAELLSNTTKANLDNIKILDEELGENIEIDFEEMPEGIKNQATLFD